MKKYAILCVNRGIWGGRRSLLKSDGKVVYFDDKEKAQQKVDSITKSMGNINNFNEYFVTEIKEV